MAPFQAAIQKETIFHPPNRSERSKRTRVALVVGTRPELIKCWPVMEALTESRDLFPHLVLTGQHDELARQAVELFGLKPDRDFRMMRRGQSLSRLASRLIRALDREFSSFMPDAVLVQGDTTSAWAAALAAFHLDIPVGHIEAGLRSHDPRHPFPEEMNRRLISCMARLHFAPTPLARELLIQQGVDPTRVWVTGNTGIDALLRMSRQLDDAPLSSLLAQRLATGPLRKVVVTIHRRENQRHLSGMGEAIWALAERFEDVEFYCPLHPSPVIQRCLRPILVSHPRCHILDPLDYADFVTLLKSAHLVMTDSGGIQEEAPTLGIPVVVMRRTTERPEAVEAGVARVVGDRKEHIVAAAAEILGDSCVHQSMARPVWLFGDGRASERIIALLRSEVAASASESSSAMTFPALTAV